MAGAGQRDALVLAIGGPSRATAHHTDVGVVRFTTQAGRFRWTGTLISPTVVLTAGHCTGDTGSSPPAESAARAANYITGTAYPDPGWTGTLSISQQGDRGVVVLSAPAASK